MVSKAQPTMIEIAENILAAKTIPWSHAERLESVSLVELKFGITHESLWNEGVWVFEVQWRSLTGQD